MTQKSAGLLYAVQCGLFRLCWTKRKAYQCPRPIWIALQHADDAAGTTIEVAVASCNADPMCGGIVDDSCDNSGYTKCTVGTVWFLQYTFRLCLAKPVVGKAIVVEQGEGTHMYPLSGVEAGTTPIVVAVTSLNEMRYKRIVLAAVRIQ